ncbi:MAG: glycosyl hydrolase [Promethearchaeota archaeon]
MKNKIHRNINTFNRWKKNGNKLKIRIFTLLILISVFISYNYIMNPGFQAENAKQDNYVATGRPLIANDGFIGDPYDPMPDTGYGVAHFEMINPANWFTGLVEYYNDSLLHQSAVMIRNAGISWNRFEFAWQYVEPANNTWVWDDIDAYMNISDYYGLKILPILCYGNPWASEGGDYLAKPINMDDWREYIRNVVLRYKDRQSFGGYWQIWNEANIENFFHGDFVNDFIPIMVAAAQEIRNTCNSCKIIATSLTGNNMGELVQTMVEAIGKEVFSDLFDAISIHPYGEYNKAIEKITSTLDYLKDWYRGEIWITEYGWSTSGFEHLNLKKEYQANLIAKVLVESRALGISHTIIHMWCDWGVGYPKIQDPAEGEHWFGIVDINGTPKPAYYIYKTIANRIGVSKYLGNGKITGFTENDIGFKSFIFQNNQSTFLFLWSQFEQPVEISFPFVCSYIKFNHLGNITESGNSDKLNLLVNERFQMIEINSSIPLNASSISIHLIPSVAFIFKFITTPIIVVIAIVSHYLIKKSSSNVKSKSELSIK